MEEQEAEVVCYYRMINPAFQACLHVTGAFPHAFLPDWHGPPVRGQQGLYPAADHPTEATACLVDITEVCTHPLAAFT